MRTLRADRRAYFWVHETRLRRSHAETDADVAHVHSWVCAAAVRVRAGVVRQQLAPGEGVSFGELLVAGHYDLLRQLAFRRVAHLPQDNRQDEEARA